jgi:tRNA A-37 threonylcarbamoyl transferase component Bud32
MERVVIHDPAAPAPLIDALWANVDTLIDAGKMLKDGDRCTVVRIDALNGAELKKPLVIKRYNAKSQFHTATHVLLRSRASWAWLNGRRLAGAGLLTPHPVACIEERRWGVLRLGSTIVTEYVAGHPLREVIDNEKTTDSELRELAAKFVAIWRTLGIMRIGHGDMKATNFIVDPQRRLWLIDLDGMRSYTSSAILRRERRKDLTRFMANWSDRPDVAAIFRARIGTG